MRNLSEIAREIHEKWTKVYFGAVPYLRAMLRLNSLNDMYGDDDAESIVLYFLSNAQTWRGEDARRIKKELNDMLKEYRKDSTQFAEGETVVPDYLY